MVKSARTQGLAVPVLLVGYYKPVREYSYGEEKLLRDCKAAGVDGLVIVDLAPEDAVQFRGLCRSKGSVYPIFWLTFALSLPRFQTIVHSSRFPFYSGSSYGDDLQPR